MYPENYKSLWVKMLKGMIKFGEIEKRRYDGDYADDVEAAFPLSADLRAKQTVSITPVKEPSIPFEEVIEEYKKRPLGSKTFFSVRAG